ncbi:Growth-regulating factor like [Actinidia chinensis var. chinensis]|uniref:Growth-regulating factor n=1 Tax=Actinidia chinensis var. chinensis TaxID=1590841 RepID=A0A2R6PI33_ACTCC|nr:Growth-regulating factor like [Actinidia chinensis var. chinensis]
MDHQYPPSKIARLADHAPRGLETRVNGLGLSLGIGGGCSKSRGFTFLQMRELEHQSLIYNYIEAGLPVPCHLILPVWKSFASSLTGLNGGLHQLYSSKFQGCSSLYNEYKNSMEPEPGRCRRTDGKKWRCSKDVVPNYKYCERHIHRGRRRHGREKHFEVPQFIFGGGHSTVSTIKDPFRT